MIIGVLLCDSVHPDRRHLEGDYPEIFTNLFRNHAPDDVGVALRFYDVTNGHYPARLDECHGYLTTGASTSVMDDAPWIADFAEFICHLYEQQVKLFGICFGHQMIAHALGGRVKHSERGWGVGIHEVAVTQPEPWMTPGAESFRIANSHQDQVAELPPGATVLASTPHCPISLFRCGSLLGIQGHPEFSVSYARLLLESRSEIIPPATRDHAYQSFSQEPDHALLVSWIVRYLQA